jgi:hypothetical protein
VNRDEINGAIDAHFRDWPAYDDDYRGKAFSRDVDVTLDLARFLMLSPITVSFDHHDRKWEVTIGKGSVEHLDLAEGAAWALLQHLNG